MRRQARGDGGQTPKASKQMKSNVFRNKTNKWNPIKFYFRGTGRSVGGSLGLASFRWLMLPKMLQPITLLLLQVLLLLFYFMRCLRIFCWANRILAIAQSLTVVFFDYLQNSWLLWCWHSERKRDSETEQLVAAVCCYCCLLMNETCFKYKRRVLRNFNVEYKQFQIVVRDLVIQVLLLLLLLLISILFFGGWSYFSCFF